MSEKIQETVRSIRNLDFVIAEGDLITLHFGELPKVQMTNEELAYLLPAAKQGDEEARNKIWLAKSYIAFQTVVRLGIRTDGERRVVDFNDLYQEASVGISEAIQKFSLFRYHPGAFNYFVKKVCESKVIDSLRQTGKRLNRDGTRRRVPRVDGVGSILIDVKGESLSSNSYYMEYVVSEENTEEEALRHLRGDRLDWLMEESKLEESHEQIIRMRLELGMKFDEIAQEMGESIDNITARFYRGLRKVRKIAILRGIDINDF